LITYAFTFTAPGHNWTREFDFASDEAAIAEGRRLLMSQAALHGEHELRMRISTQVNKGDQPLGAWLWTAGSDSWHPEPA
jgi:hypothetical protein